MPKGCCMTNLLQKYITTYLIMGLESNLGVQADIFRA